MADSSGSMLIPEIRDELLRTHQTGMMESWLPSLQQLETYYSNFRQRFGIDRLPSIDGEALPTAAHSSSASTSG